MNQDITPPSNNQQTGSPQGFGAPSAPETTEQPTGQVIPLQSGPKKGKLKAFFLVLLFLLLLAAVGGAYFYQQGKIDDAVAAKTALNSKTAALQSQLSTTQAKALADAKKAVTPAAASYDVVTGPVTTQATGSATLNGLYKSGTVDEVWIEYGTAPDTLTTSTKHILSKDLPTAAAGTYGQQGFTVTGLKSSQNYFYRVAAKNKTATVYGGVTSFTSVK